jgi:hypothetical protein
MTWGSDLHVKKLREAPSNGRSVWLLQSELAFNSDTIGPIVVPQGFQTDFASVPRIPLAYLLAGGTADASAVVHDWLYRYGKCTKRQADEVFLEAMAAEGVPWWRARLMYRAVRMFGRRKP